jgi:hypothetical protein
VSSETHEQPHRLPRELSRSGLAVPTRWTAGPPHHLAAMPSEARSRRAHVIEACFAYCAPLINGSGVGWLDTGRAASDERGRDLRGSQPGQPAHDGTLRRWANSRNWAAVSWHPSVQSNSTGRSSIQPTAAVRPQPGQTSQVTRSLTRAPALATNCRGCWQGREPLVRAVDPATSRLPTARAQQHPSRELCRPWSGQGCTAGGMRFSGPWPVI